MRLAAMPEVAMRLAAMPEVVMRLATEETRAASPTNGLQSENNDSVYYKKSKVNRWSVIRIADISVWRFIFVLNRAPVKEAARRKSTSPYKNSP